ncbi:ribonucleoside-triphosphate reductase, adenosylcobalamin-dependent [Paraliobacillus sp. JSM ZJ581]|uniref:ribonucleoside-triphosphate reductase, adenosylcobalamin-dependent n=1 Tax=Paraliobacillus sp. JSM ZJ581 TaxID=3342118 RepID=UPI0035A9883A
MLIEYITDDFVEKTVNHTKNPLTEIGNFVYTRTYSRWKTSKNRREYWHETVQRAVNYNMTLASDHLKKIGLAPDYRALQKEAERIFVNIYQTKQFPSGRTLWLGGGNDVINEKFTLGNFNCSFTNIKNWKDLSEVFYLLLVGTGIGIKSTLNMAKSMPKIKTNVKVLHSEYKPVPKEERLEHSKLVEIGNGFVKIYIGDSKEGWVESLELYLQVLTKKEYKHIHTVKFSYNSVRPNGERLKTFGGTASGHEPLKSMYKGFANVLSNKIDESLAPIEIDEDGYGQVRPIHILDMANLIGANVVVGGVRRTAEIFLSDADDIEVLLAKYGINGFWSQDHFDQHEVVKHALLKNGVQLPKWFEEMSLKQHAVSYDDGKDLKYFNDKDTALAFANQVGGYHMYPVHEPRKNIDHRRMSNNSIAFTSKPTDERLSLQFELLKGEGEPAFVNLEEGARRVLKQLGDENPTRSRLEYIMEEIGLNPCVEILLFSKNVCNLTTVNLTAFVNEDRTLDEEGLLQAQRDSARIGLRMTLAELELDAWNKVQKRDRLLGTSLTGWKDAMALLGYTDTQEEELQRKLHHASRSEAEKYAKELRINAPLLVTAVKPEGTLSQVARNPITDSPVSSGLHWSHSPYYIRRIRVSEADPLAKVALDLGWTVNPEVGTEGDSHEERIANAKTLVIDFPVASGADKTKDDISVDEQFDNYFSFQNNYTEHNTSNTITVKPNEWKRAEERVKQGWDNFVGVSFLALDGGTYQLTPYEAITKEAFEEKKAKMTPFTAELLQQYEVTDNLEDADLGNDGCTTGACPIR